MKYYIYNVIKTTFFGQQCVSTNHVSHPLTVYTVTNS